MEKYVEKGGESVYVYAEPMNGLEAVKQGFKERNFDSKYDNIDGYHMQLIHDYWLPKDLFINSFQKCDDQTPSKEFLELSHKLK